MIRFVGDVRYPEEWAAFQASESGYFLSSTREWRLDLEAQQWLELLPEHFWVADSLQMDPNYEERSDEPPLPLVV